MMTCAKRQGQQYFSRKISTVCLHRLPERRVSQVRIHSTSFRRIELSVSCDTRVCGHPPFAVVLSPTSSPTGPEQHRLHLIPQLRARLRAVTRTAFLRRSPPFGSLRQPVLAGQQPDEPAASGRLQRPPSLACPARDCRGTAAARQTGHARLTVTGVTGRDGT